MPSHCVANYYVASDVILFIVETKIGIMKKTTAFIIHSSYVTAAVLLGAQLDGAARATQF